MKSGGVASSFLKVRNQAGRKSRATPATARGTFLPTLSIFLREPPSALEPLVITTPEVESFFVELWYGTALALRRDEALERGQLRAWLRAWLLLEPCDTP